MLFEAILHEVEQLHSVSTRLEGLAEQHALVSEALTTIRGKRSQECHYPGSRGGNEKPQADLST